MSKQIMYVDVNYNCPVCGKEIKRVKITKEYIRCFNKNNYTFELQYSCNCASKISQIVAWRNQINQDFTQSDIANYFINASNKAYEQSLKNIGVESEG